jgi:hypothetical protein
VTDKLQSAVERGHRVKNILDDAIFKEAADHVEAECFRLFKVTHPTDTEALAQIAGIQYLHTKYLAFLTRAVQDGKLAQIEIDRESKLKRMTRRLVG